MITKDSKISKLLEEYPDSLDILLKLTPDLYSKLHSGLLGKALADRITIEQTASIAGVDLNVLLKELNEYKDNTGAEITRTEQKAAIQNSPESLQDNEPVDTEKIITLDVRPILDSGKDPLQNILAKVKELKTGEILMIINTFEPIPLYTLLEKKGFLHRVEKENDIYKVYFYKEGNVENPSQNSPAKAGIEINENDFENIINLDVHELQPPEPMMLILENLHRVDEKSVMLVYHHREPHLLYPKLEERGYQAVCHKLGEDNYKILISKKRDT